MVTTDSPTRRGSSRSSASGLPVSIWQKSQRRVHWSPPMRKVASRSSQHSKMLGQPASWHTVCRPSAFTSCWSSRYWGPIVARVLIHSGLRSIGVSALRTSRRSSLRPSGAGCRSVTPASLRGDGERRAFGRSAYRGPECSGGPDVTPAEDQDGDGRHDDQHGQQVDPALQVSDVLEAVAVTGPGTPGGRVEELHPGLQPAVDVVAEGPRPDVVQWGQVADDLAPDADREQERQRRDRVTEQHRQGEGTERGAHREQHGTQKVPADVGG